MTGDELREIRTSFGMSQDDVATFCGVARQTAGDWERGQFRVPPLLARVMIVLRRRPELIYDLYPEFVDTKWKALNSKELGEIPIEVVDEEE